MSSTSLSDERRRASAAALDNTEAVALALSLTLGLDYDQAERVRVAAGYVLRGRREDGLPLTPQDAADDRKWAAEFALAMGQPLPAQTVDTIVRLWAEQRERGARTA